MKNTYRFKPEKKIKVIDLSLNIYHGAPTFAYDPKCAVIVHNTIESIGYNITQLSISTHQGTHLDAPFHFLNDGKKVNQIPLDSCIGKAIKVDISYKKPKEAITVKDFEPYKNKITKGSKVICQTGWDNIYPKDQYFKDFPFLSKELADWFAEREISLLGIDTPAPNPIDWKYVHETLLRKNIVIVEGLANLNSIKKEEFLFIALPLKLVGRDGSPIRAVAIE